MVFPQIDIKYGFTDPVDLQYFESQVPVMEQKLQAFKQVCLKGPSAEFLPYVGTTATVRDLVAIAEYFDGEGCDVNYYGFSYGTLIGNYLVNSKSSTPPPHPKFSLLPVFPNRVGRVILDGVLDPLTHTDQPSHLAWAHTVESEDETFQGFAQGCALSGPYGCPISTNTSTEQGIIDWTRDLVSVGTFAHCRSKVRSHPK